MDPDTPSLGSLPCKLVVKPIKQEESSSNDETSPKTLQLFTLTASSSSHPLYLVRVHQHERLQKAAGLRSEEDGAENHGLEVWRIGANHRIVIRDLEDQGGGEDGGKSKGKKMQIQDDIFWLLYESKFNTTFSFETYQPTMPNQYKQVEITDLAVKNTPNETVIEKNETIPIKNETVIIIKKPEVVGPELFDRFIYLYIFLILISLLLAALLVALCCEYRRRRSWGSKVVPLEGTLAEEKEREENCFMYCGQESSRSEAALWSGRNSNYRSNSVVPTFGKVAFEDDEKIKLGNAGELMDDKVQTTIDKEKEKEHNEAIITSEMFNQN